MSFIKKIIFISFCIFSSFLVNAAHAISNWSEVKFFIDDLVENYNFDRNEITNILKEAKFQPKIIESMDRPYEKKKWDVYKSLFLTKKRLDSGVEFWQKNKKDLIAVEKKYGVPADVIVAIIGIETLYGEKQGNYRVLDALTTLAFNYPSRSKFFTKELREYLLLCKDQKVPATKYYGSYAGAIGVPQFMPSSYRYYAIDANGNGQADLMNNNKDVIFSVANYFKKNGWSNNAEVAEPAKITSNAYKKLATNTTKPNYKFTNIISSGVVPKISRMKHPVQAGVIQLETDQGKEYWLGYDNFYVITRYNNSPQYALVVHLLSEQLRNKVLPK